MGLFKKKEKIPDGIKVVYYDGELNDFQCNFPCHLLLMEDVLRITKVNPNTEVKLDRVRILSIDIFAEVEYMAKYKGNQVTTTKEKGIPKSYYVIKYLKKGGDAAHLDFWGTSLETLKIMKMREEIIKAKTSNSYEI